MERLRAEAGMWEPDRSGDPDLYENAAAEIERLTAQLKTAVWSDSEHCKLVEADNARLRAAINEAINSLAAIGQTDNAAYRRLKNLDEQ